MAVRGGDEDATGTVFVGSFTRAKIARVHNRRERKRTEVARRAERRRREVNPIPSSIFPLEFSIQHRLTSAHSFGVSFIHLHSLRLVRLP